jgi:hypothetical protein
MHKSQNYIFTKNCEFTICGENALLWPVIDMSQQESLIQAPKQYLCRLQVLGI